MGWASSRVASIQSYSGRSKWARKQLNLCVNLKPKRNILERGRKSGPNINQARIINSNIPRLLPQNPTVLELLPSPPSPQIEPQNPSSPSPSPSPATPFNPFPPATCARETHEAMESALASAAAIADQRQKIEQYRHILASVLSSSPPDIAQAKRFLDHSNALWSNSSCKFCSPLA